MDVSFLIPARNETYLAQTIFNLLANIRGDSEVLVALDGYLPDPPIETKSERVIFFHYPESIGQRQAINALARHARGKYVCKLDAHCAIDEGFDVKMMADCEYDWTVIPRMYNLDIKTFLPKHHKLTDYMYIGLRENGELRAEYYTGREYKRQHKATALIDDTMCCMGPCFFMHKNRFWELGGCDETHGGWGQQGIEVACKAWLSGGALKVNKKTWFSHWFRGGSGPGFPYPLSGRAVSAARRYSKDLWLNNKWPQQKREFQWLLNKFKPPGWNNNAETKETTAVNPEQKALAQKRAFLHRRIREIYRVQVRNDFSPIGTHRGTRESLIPLWQEAGYKLGVEIGVHRAYFSHQILRGSKDIVLHSIDPWAVYSESHFTQEGQDRNYQIAMNTLEPFIKTGRCIVHRKPAEDVVNQFADASLDFIFIDGAHSFNHCVMDLIQWTPKIKPGGMVAVHDYTPMRRGGVIEAVDAFTKCNMIAPWYCIRELIPSVFWVV